MYTPCVFYSLKQYFRCSCTFLHSMQAMVMQYLFDLSSSHLWYSVNSFCKLISLLLNQYTIHLSAAYALPLTYNYWLLYCRFCIFYHSNNYSIFPLISLTVNIFLHTRFQVLIFSVTYCMDRFCFILPQGYLFHTSK